MQQRPFRAAWLALAFAAATSAAAAQEAPAGDPFDAVDSLSSGVLDAEVVTPGSLTLGLSSQTVTATNSGNTVIGEVIENGDIVLSSDAFSGFTGIGNFVLNTGNNNNLQGSIGVVVILTPPSSP